MKSIFALLVGSVSYKTMAICLALVRIGLGILSIGHGVPKIMGGISTWRHLGSMTASIGIYFLPVMWGFLGACTEFFGGIALVLGLGTRVACFALVLMMIVATAWHIERGDSFSLYSFPLSLIIIFTGFLVIGGGFFSIDYLLSK